MQFVGVSVIKFGPSALFYSGAIYNHIMIDGNSSSLPTCFTYTIGLVSILLKLIKIKIRFMTTRAAASSPSRRPTAHLFVEHKGKSPSQFTSISQ